MNRDTTPGPPEGQEPIEELFRDLFGLADETARQITDAEVDARLDQLLRKTGHAAPPAPEPDPASVLDASRRQAAQIVTDAQRAAAQTEAEATCAAQAAGEAARREAGRIVAEAEEYSDMALRRAAAIIADARSQAESIIAEAGAQAGQIVADARLRAARADSGDRHLALTDTRVRDPYSAGPPTTWPAMTYCYFGAPVGFKPPEPHEQRPLLSALVDRAASDNKADVTSEIRVLKFSLGAPEDRETPGWIRRGWSSVRARMRLRWSGSSPASWLMTARADGVVTSFYYVCTLDDDAHVRDIRWLVLNCLRETTGEEQPASQAGGLAGIHEKVTACSIESNCRSAQIIGSQREHTR